MRVQHKFLALIPSTLKGACHLGVQPHIGNHSTKHQRRSRRDDNLMDDGHPKSYHQHVADEVTDISELFPLCGNDMSDGIIGLMNDLSVDILRDIQRFKLELTSTCETFHPRSLKGCGDRVKFDASDETPVPECNSGRNHEGEENPRNEGDDNPENIGTGLSQGSYQLRLAGK